MAQNTKPVHSLARLLVFSIRILTFLLSPEEPGLACGWDIIARVVLALLEIWEQYKTRAEGQRKARRKEGKEEGQGG